FADLLFRHSMLENVRLTRLGVKVEPQVHGRILILQSFALIWLLRAARVWSSSLLPRFAAGLKKVPGGRKPISSFFAPKSVPDTFFGLDQQPLGEHLVVVVVVRGRRLDALVQQVELVVVRAEPEPRQPL